MNTRRLLCKLDDQDILIRGQQLANAEKEYADIEAEKKTANQHFKDSMDAIGGRIYTLSAAIRDREEIRDVEVIVQDDNLMLKHRVVRLDTGEIVESYDFTEKERQGTLI